MPCWHGKQRCKPLRRPTAEISESPKAPSSIPQAGTSRPCTKRFRQSTRKADPASPVPQLGTFRHPQFLPAYPSSAGDRAENLSPYAGRNGIHQAPLFFGVNALTTGFAIMMPGLLHNPQSDRKKQNREKPNDNVISTSKEFLQTGVLTTGAPTGMEFFIGGHLKIRIYQIAHGLTRKTGGKEIGLGARMPQANPHNQISISPCSRRAGSPDFRFLRRPSRRSWRKPHNFPPRQYRRNWPNGCCR